MAPPNSNIFSVRVVLPASGCEMIAKVRRRATGSGSFMVPEGWGKAWRLPYPACAARGRAGGRLRRMERMTEGGFPHCLHGGACAREEFEVKDRLSGDRRRRRALRARP